jgi:hypothetical protein
MAYRIPRGYERNRPQYQEISQGIRPENGAVPMEAYTGLPPVRIDETTNDPIVLDAGTIVGFATGGLADGYMFPAHSGSSTGETMTLYFSSTDTTWGLPGSDVTSTPVLMTAGPVKPLGMIYMPIYSFMLQAQFTNYKRNENVGFVTDYMIQVPATTTEERALRVGDLVQTNDSLAYGRSASLDAAAGDVIEVGNMGRMKAYDGTAAGMEYVIGRVIGKLIFAESGTASATLEDDTSNFALTTAGAAEFKGLNMVQTVPGLGLAGSGTGGVPAWLTGAIADGSGNYTALTILVRL